MDFEALATKYAAELSYIDALFQREGISYNRDDMLIAIDGAWRAIASYMWIDYSNLTDDYHNAVIRLAIAYYNNNQIVKGNLQGVLRYSQVVEAKRSFSLHSNVIEFDRYGLTAEVKAMLPVRKLRSL